MVEQKQKKETKKKRAIFKLEAPEAKEVCLTGDFNNWNTETHIMKKDKKGVWSKTVMLSPGRYEYKFLVDGQWQNDPNSQNIVSNRFGTFNDVLMV